jgi:hypothetical protein
MHLKEVSQYWTEVMNLLRFQEHLLPLRLQHLQLLNQLRMLKVYGITHVLKDVQAVALQLHLVVYAVLHWLTTNYIMLVVQHHNQQSQHQLDLQQDNLLQ